MSGDKSYKFLMMHRQIRQIFTFHVSTSVFLVPLAFLGGLGGSGSELNVVKLTASEGLPSKQLHAAWTLRDSKTFTHSTL